MAGEIPRSTGIPPIRPSLQGPHSASTRQRSLGTDGRPRRSGGCRWPSISAAVLTDSSPSTTPVRRFVFRYSYSRKRLSTSLLSECLLRARGIRTS